jgi:hypothetical protein
MRLSNKLLAVVPSLTLVIFMAAPAQAQTTVQRLGYCGGDDWEPTVATAPGGYVYELITHYAGNTSCDPASAQNDSRIMIQVSADGGKTFGAPRVVANTPAGIAYPSQADPGIAVDPTTGAVYVSFLAFGLSGGHLDVIVAKSTDHGSTFNQGVLVNSQGCKSCDHPKILASNNDVYVAYSQAQYHFLALSTNGGQTFTQTTADSSFVVAFAEQGVLDSHGNAWFAWGDCESSNCTGVPAADYRVSETLAGTTNTTFSPALAQTPQGPDCPFSSCGFAYFGAQDALAIDGGGTLYLAYQKGQQNVRKSPPVIMLASCSSNCTSGSSWKTVGRVDDKTASNCPNASCYALFPNIVGGASAGKISATWMDDRNDSLDGTVDHVDGWNLWYRTSTNGGSTWTTPGQRISSNPPDPNQSQEAAAGFLFPYGDYTGLAVNASCRTQAPVITWGEGHNWVGGASNPGHIEFTSLC